MLSISKANSILSVIEEVKYLLIDVKQDDYFSCEFGLLDYTITIPVEDTRKDHHKWMESYLMREYSLQDHERLFDGFEYVFALLHEVGHILESKGEEYEKVGYNEYKQGTYFTKEQAYRAYRQIPSEKAADTKAMELLRKYIVSIWAIMEDITEE